MKITSELLGKIVRNRILTQIQDEVRNSAGILHNMYRLLLKVNSNSLSFLVVRQKNLVSILYLSKCGVINFVTR